MLSISFPGPAVVQITGQAGFSSFYFDVEQDIERMLSPYRKNRIAGGPHVRSVQTNRSTTSISYGPDRSMLLETSRPAVEGIRSLPGERLA